MLGHAPPVVPAALGRTFAAAGAAPGGFSGGESGVSRQAGFSFARLLPAVRTELGSVGNRVRNCAEGNGWQSGEAAASPEHRGAEGPWQGRAEGWAR